MNAVRTGVPVQFARLLDSRTPRALWSDLTLYPNPAFTEATGLECGSPLDIGVLRDVIGGEPAGEFLLAGYRTAASLLTKGSTSIVLLELRERDLTQTSLVSIVSAYERASNWQRLLPEFVDTLLSLPNRLFTRVVVLRARPSEPFLVVGGIGQFARGDRSWLRWPLRRLYEVRRAARITNSMSGETAIAFPMQHGDERTVAIAVLSDREFTISESDLLVTLETMRFTPSDRIHEDVVDMDDPRFLWVGKTHPLFPVMSDLAERRGWHLQTCPRLAEIAEAVASSSPDVVVFNAEAFPNAAHVLRTVRETFIGQITIVGIGRFAMPRSESAALLDGELASDASPQTVLEALKAGVRSAVSARRRDAKEAVRAARRVVSRVRSVHQLSAVGAQEACALVGGWAAVHLIDEKGRMNASEAPANRSTSLLPHLPELFISGESIVQTFIEDSFYEALTTDPARLGILRALGAYSGVAVPIVGSGVRTLGVLTAIALNRRSTREELAAVSEFAGIISQRYEQLRRRPPELDVREPWRRGALAGLEFASFTPPSSTLCARLMPLDSHRCALLVCQRRNVVEIMQRLRRHATVAEALGDVAGFAGIANTANSTLSFAVNQMPFPMVAGGTAGPWGSVDGLSHGASSGSLGLRDGMVAVVTEFVTGTDFGPEMNAIRDLDELTSSFDPQNYGGVIIALAMRSPDGS